MSALTYACWNPSDWNSVAIFMTPLEPSAMWGKTTFLPCSPLLPWNIRRAREATIIGKNRANILETLKPWTDEEIQKNTFRAQYHGYKDIKGVKPNSETETYFALKTELLHPRWKGIPIFMEAGKRMAEMRKEIVLTLKHPPSCLLCAVGPHEPNRIVFRLEPNDEIIIHFWTKKPGFERVLEERVFSFSLHEKEMKAQYVEEYAKILYASMRGEQTFLFLRRKLRRPGSLRIR